MPSYYKNIVLSMGYKQPGLDNAHAQYTNVSAIKNSQENSLTRKPLPKPSYLGGIDYLGFVHGDRRWRSLCGRRLYTWDEFHGEIEVFSKRGKHLGVIDAISGENIKDAVKGRTIDV